MQDSASSNTLDRATMIALQCGDKGALATLYGRHHAHLLSIGRRMTRSHEEAEDLVHEVFVEVWQHAGEYEPSRATVRTWLSMRMRSRCLDRLRAAAVVTAVRNKTQDEISAYTSASDLPRLIDARRATIAAQALPTEQREVLELGYFRGLSSSEIAAHLGVPIGTVKSRVRTAIERLREDLGGDS